MDYGILSLLPIVVMFVLIFTTKRTLLALTCATLVGAALLGGWGFAGVWLEKIQAAFAAGTVGYLFMLLALFGILIKLLEISGFAIEFANWLSKFANTRRKALLLTYLLGWSIFVDDYLNNMAVAAAMKGVCDKHKVSRTMFGFVVNATGATDCCIIPVSTWAVFYSGLFEKYGIVKDGSGFKALVSGIPYAFYPWALAIVCFLVIIGVIPLMGITRRDQKYADETGILCTPEINLDGQEIRVPEDTPAGTEVKKNPLKFLTPIAVIIAITIITKDVMVACMGSILVTAVLLLATKAMSLKEIFDASFEGVAGNVQICCVIAMALTLVEINNSTGMPAFVVGALTPILQHASFAFPALVFAFCAAYSFFAGGFWDGSMLFMPIIVPIAHALNMNPLLACMALICAAAAGSTTYVAGDAVMITARAVDIKPIYETRAILPYALIAYVASILAFLITGLAWT